MKGSFSIQQPALFKISYYTYNLKFRHPFTISKGTKTHQPVFIVELEWRGLKGYGEAPAISYYNIPVEKMVADLEAKKIFIEKYAFTEPGRFWHYLHHLFPNNSFLVCALDMAFWDLYGKIKGKPLYQLWNLDLKDAPPTDFTIGIDSIEKMIGKMKEKPWPVYKIKAGTGYDIEMLTGLRKHTKAVFRVDANAAWTVEEALDKIPKCKALGVELVEQPLAKDNWDGMKILFEQSALPLYADESCVAETDVEKCYQHFHGINIKLTKCGGITPAMRMIEQAKKLGIRVMIGCMNESTIGTAAIAHLAPLVDCADMDGTLLLEDDLATGVSFLADGHVQLSGKPGLGITFTAY